MSECRHDDSSLATLTALFVEPTRATPPMWLVRCDVCGRHTQLCLTHEEARLRGAKEWWA